MERRNERLSDGDSGGCASQGKKVIAAIHNLLRQSYSPKGLDALYSGAYDRLTPDMPLGQYYYGLNLMPYSCVKNIAKPDEETNTSLFVKANNPDIPFSREIVAAEIDEQNKAHYGWLKKMPVQKKGAWFLGEQEQTSGMGVKVKNYQWLITYDQKLPFQYVTRKEYLKSSPPASARRTKGTEVNLRTVTTLSMPLRIRR